RPERIDWAKKYLQDRGYTFDIEQPGRLIAIHPGMGGSALNWPENYYVDLARALLKEGHTVLLTGGHLEAHLIERIQSELKDDSAKLITYTGIDPGSTPPKFLGVDYLAALFHEASVVVAPSTGPLHVAVALKKGVVSFYPPIRVQSALRWGPYTTGEDSASILVPEVYCGEDFKCRGPVCNYYPCMKTIQPRQALNEVHLQLSRVSREEELARVVVEENKTPLSELPSETTETNIDEKPETLK
ncbi:hypothetical protein EON80_24710, partial [bacterium]